MSWNHHRAASLPLAAAASCLLAAASLGLSWSAAAESRAGVMALAPARLSRPMALLPVVPATHRVHLGFVLGSAHPAALARYATAVSTPGSPLYHHFLTAQEMGQRFGPSPLVIRHDRQAIARLGFRVTGQQGWILYAAGTAGELPSTLGVSLHQGRVDNGTWIAPGGPLALPPSLQDVVTVTGLVEQLTAPRRPLPAPQLDDHAVPRSDRRGTTVSGTTVVDGYTVSAVWSPSTGVETGLPDSVAVTVDAPDGAPATTDSIASVNELSGPGTVWTGDTLGPDAEGTMTLPVTADTAGTYAIQLGLTPQSGSTPSLTVTLPPVTFVGSDAVDGPNSPADLTDALGAQAVVASAPTTPATIGLYAQAAPDVSDLTTFEAANGLTPLAVNEWSVDGYTPPPLNVQNGSDQELALDLESLAMSAPGATVDVTEVNPNLGWPEGLVDALNAVIGSGHPSVYSLSFGAPELESGQLAWAPSDLTAMETGVEAANVEGITVVNAAGDNGAFATGGDEPLPLSPSVAVPADLPDVTAVGGMDFRSGVGGTGLATTSWGGDAWLGLPSTFLQTQVNQANGNGNLLGGGGYSATYPVPSWQTAVLPAGAAGRGVPDLAMPASLYFPGVVMELGGQSVLMGGTSMAAPLFAGYLADISAQSHEEFGNLNPDLYQAAAANPSLMTQAQYGYDGYWSVVPGAAWNPLTGLGTPNVGELAVALGDIAAAAAPAHLTMASTPVWANAGGTVALSAVLTTASGDPITTPTAATVSIGKPDHGGTELEDATITNGQLTPLRFTRAGLYTVTVAVGAVWASVTLHVAPGWPATFRYHAAPAYTPGALWREGLAAYDVYGNLDTRVRGTVVWTWRLDGHVYHDASVFADGIAWGQVGIPARASGPLTTAVTIRWTEAPLP